MKADKKGGAVLTNDERSTIVALFSGTLIAYAITCIAFIACAILLRYSAFSENNVTLYVTITSVVSVVVSGFDVARNADKNGWLWGLVSGGVYAIILLCIGIWVSGSFGFDMRTLTLIILSLAGGGLGGVVGINFKK